MTIQKHHYVPEVYLKEFADSQKNLFVLKARDGSISRKSTSQVCYKPNLYKIHSEDTLLLNKLNDPYHVEKIAFKKQENSYTKILKQIISPSIQPIKIKRSDLVLFLETLITIKRRNPSSKKNIINAYKQYFKSNEFNLAIQEVMEFSKRIDKIDPKQYVDDYVDDVMNNNEKQSDMFLQRFINDANNGISRLVNMILNYKMYVCHAPFGSQYITSDNPGFTIANQKLYSFGGFGLQFEFVFPLSPKTCLFVSREFKDKSLHLQKDIHPIYVSNSDVENLNLLTHQMQLERVLSYRPDELIRLKSINPSQG